jgi:hypothetical protein
MDSEKNLDNEIEEKNLEYRNHYYYTDDYTKVDVKFEMLDDNKVKKTTSTYFIESYPTSVANKIKERSKWEKFGSAKNDGNKECTQVGEEVFLEFNPDLKHLNFKKKEPLYIHNKKFYYEQSESFREIVDQIEKENGCEKKKLISCRHCGSGNHWSIKCPKLEEKKSYDKENKTYDRNNRDNRDNKDNRNNRYQSDYKKEKNDDIKLIGLKLTDLDSSLNDNEIKKYLYNFGDIVHYYNVKGKGASANSTIYVTYSTQEQNNDAIEKIKRTPVGYTIPSVEFAKPRNNY